MTDHKPVVPYYDRPDYEPPTRWWDNHDNLVTLCNWLANNGRTGGEVAYAVEKPWKYEDEFDEAAKEQEEAS